ncbi:adenosylcobinamide-phosphate synthase CbiB [bacterium]|nr:adenosylcobinamide-phosphate synthase CbiB [bacterium]
MNPLIFSCAYLLDLIIGDPEWFPHPVRFIGKMIQSGECTIRKVAKDQWSEFVGGSLVSIFLVAGTYLATYLILKEIESWNKTISVVLSVYLASTTLATCCLLNEVRRVLKFLQSGSLKEARVYVSRIVGRDTRDLNDTEIVRAAIETLAESSSDGIVAPMFYLAMGGVPAAIAYKTINTLDSMIGHRDSRYEYFGKFAARLDDIANFIPARITAFLITFSAFFCRMNWRGAWKIWQRDGRKHQSPNAGRPEAAIAGALGVRLGGLNFYSGEPHRGAFFGEPLAPLTCDALERALILVKMVSVLSFLIFLTILWYSYSGLH